jgi:hypothetical protein
MARLLHNVPGEVVVIDLPLSALSAFDHEISVKSILRDIAPSKPKTAAQPLQGSKHIGENNENVGKSHLHQLGNGMNTFAKFIEEMERKYTGQHHSNVGSSSDEEDDGGEEDGMILDGDSLDSSMEGEDGKIDAAAAAGVEGKKKRRTRDFYDYDEGDGFIDDGEVEEEIHQLITGKKKKTKHSGFFQSDGQDELETETPAVAPTRPTPKTGAAGAASSSSKGGSVTFAPSPPGSAERKKTPWNPTPNALLALQTFKSSVRVLSFYPLRRNDPFSPELEKPLLQLDALIRKEQGDTALARTTGYHEAVAAALGGEVPIARVAIFLKRLQLKVETDKHKRLLLAAIQELKETLTSKVSVCAVATTMPGDDGAATAAGDSPPKGAAPPTGAAADGDDEKVAYTHQVRWDVVTRTLLVSIEQHVENWLLGENRLRDTPDLGPKEPPLEKAQELTGIFNHVRDTAFSHLGAGALVKGGDVATMKRRLSEEKQRLKKKEKEAAEQQAKRSWGSEALGLDQLSSSSSATASSSSSAAAAAAAAVVGTPFAFGPQSPSSKKAVSSKSQKKGPSHKPSFVLPPSDGTSATTDGLPLTTKKRPAATKKTGPAFGSTYARMCPFDAADFLEESGPSSIEADAGPASVIFVAPKPKKHKLPQQQQQQQCKEKEEEDEEDEEEELKKQAVTVPSENEQVYEMYELEDEDAKESEEKGKNEQEQEQEREQEQEQEREREQEDSLSGGLSGGTAGTAPLEIEEEK